jgi:trimethylamine--corrinoid protein Co-methyltransferase
MSTVAGVLGGADMLNMGGLLDALKAFDFAKAVIDDEIALMLKRMQRGVEFSQENLALDVIAKVGPGGSFMMEDHTVKTMRTTALVPKIADRDARAAWEGKGRLDAQARGYQRARSILSKTSSAVFTLEFDAQVRAKFAGLVAGNSTLPEGW